MSQPEQKYLSVNDVSMRLWNSVVRYDGKYYWATQPTDILDDTGMKISLMSLSNQKRVYTIDANDSKLDVTSPELGWMSINGVLVYVARAPYRKQKQGVCNDNLVYYQPTSPGSSPVSHRLDNSHVFSKSFEDMLTIKATPYNEAFTALTKMAPRPFCGVPLSRHYALMYNTSNHPTLYKRVTAIGLAGPAGVKLSPEFSNSIIAMSLSNLGVPVL